MSFVKRVIRVSLLAFMQPDAWDWLLFCLQQRIIWEHFSFALIIGDDEFSFTWLEFRKCFSKLSLKYTIMCLLKRKSIDSIFETKFSSPAFAAKTNGLFIKPDTRFRDLNFPTRPAGRHSRGKYIPRPALSLSLSLSLSLYSHCLTRELLPHVCTPNYSLLSTFWHLNRVWGFEVGWL